MWSDKKNIIILVLAGLCILASIYAGYTRYSFQRYKDGAAERLTQRERELQSEILTLTNELTSARASTEELGRTIQTVHGRVSELRKLNQDVANAITRLSGSNKRLAAIFIEVARRAEQLTGEIEQLSVQHGDNSNTSKSN